MPDPPDVFRPLVDAGAFADLVGPLHVGPSSSPMAEVAESQPGRALDVGCGEGADELIARWWPLAARLLRACGVSEQQ